ncbi:hypothetical protein RRG08_007958 [Elysia crispata]|uniref:Uncharacterized protein n=1 Tax=Elysia crispata TaxID=231223 RepID=A0AAE0ZR58_9GAST|nr:hypothetical protein RRG08_007958 [Elysia crispata]
MIYTFVAQKFEVKIIWLSHYELPPPPPSFLSVSASPLVPGEPLRIKGHDANSVRTHLNGPLSPAPCAAHLGEYRGAIGIHGGNLEDGKI